MISFSCLREMAVYSAGLAFRWISNDWWLLGAPDGRWFPPPYGRSARSKPSPVRSLGKQTGMLAEFIDRVDSVGIRVRPPTKRILICGGETSRVDEPKYEVVMKSLRDSCLRSRFKAENPGFPSFDFLLIEEVHEYFDKGCPYTNLLDFEKDSAARARAESCAACHNEKLFDFITCSRCCVRICRRKVNKK